MARMRSDELDFNVGLFERAYYNTGRLLSWSVTSKCLDRYRLVYRAATERDGRFRYILDASFPTRLSMLLRYDHPPIPISIIYSTVHSKFEEEYRVFFA